MVAKKENQHGTVKRIHNCIIGAPGFCNCDRMFLQGQRYKTIHRELTTALTEEALSIETVKGSCPRFKDGDFSVADHERRERPVS
jgi:hypothetical protein